jgi:hypothetical protein
MCHLYTYFQSNRRCQKCGKVGEGVYAQKAKDLGPCHVTSLTVNCRYSYIYLCQIEHQVKMVADRRLPLEPASYYCFFSSVIPSRPHSCSLSETCFINALPPVTRSRHAATSHLVRSEVFTTATINSTMSWDVMPCRLVEIQMFRKNASFLKFKSKQRNAGKLLADSMTLHPLR